MNTVKLDSKNDLHSKDFTIDLRAYKRNFYGYAWLLGDKIKRFLKGDGWYKGWFSNGYILDVKVITFGDKFYVDGELVKTVGATEPVFFDSIMKDSIDDCSWHHIACRRPLGNDWMCYYKVPPGAWAKK